MHRGNKFTGIIRAIMEDKVDGSFWEYLVENEMTGKVHCDEDYRWELAKWNFVCSSWSYMLISPEGIPFAYCCIMDDSDNILKDAAYLLNIGATTLPALQQTLQNCPTIEFATLPLAVPNYID